MSFSGSVSSGFEGGGVSKVNQSLKVASWAEEECGEETSP